MAWKLKDLVDIPNLQMLMDRFYAATAIPVGIIATDGEILVATGWQDICTKFHRVHPVTAERCRQSDDFIKTRLTSLHPVQYKCQNGLWDVAVPIVITGQHVATLFLGQFFYDDEKIDEDFYRRQALEFGFDVSLYLDALQRTPVFTTEKVRQIIDFYTSFVNFLVSTGLSNHQRSEAEKALRESEEKFATAFDTAPIPMVITTFEDGRYLEVNEEFERQHGFAKNEIIGRTAAEVGLWGDTQQRQEIVAALKEGREVRNREVTLRDRAGGILVGLYSASVIELQGEKRLIALRTDITERKRMEEQIEILNTELAARALLLESANEELESFNYTVSHDLRRYITVISGYSALGLEFPAATAEELKNYLGEIHASSLRMEELVETLMRFSLLSRSAITRETVDLTEIARRVSLSLRSSEPERRATFILGEGLSSVGDPKLLDIALENLLDNAWKYTRRKETALIEFGATETDGARIFFVRDNGDGFDMAHADGLFRPFERLSGTDGIPGHGIGLATVQRVIQRQGGKVWAESEPGKGATFYFKL